MFSALSRLVTRRAPLVVVVWVLLITVGGAWALTGFGGGPLFDRLSAGSLPTIPGTESQEGVDIQAERDSTGETLIAMVGGVDMTDPAQLAAAGQDAGALAQDLMEVGGVQSAVNPFVLPQGLADPQAAPMVSQDEDGFLVLTTLEEGLADDDARAAHDAVVERLQGEEWAGLAGVEGASAPTVEVSSETLVGDEILAQVQQDLLIGEAISLPLALLIMIVVFGGFLAAGLPLLGAIASIVAGMAALMAVTHVTDLESFVLTVVTVLGLGLSIDYGLLIVSRFREEVRATQEAMAANDGKLPGHLMPKPRGRHAATPPDTALSDPEIGERAVRISVATAGRTVVFSALTVAISISGLLVMRPDILVTIALGGVTIVLLAVLSSVTLVPALMTLIAPRLLRPSVGTRVPGLRTLVDKLGDVAPQEGFFSRLARQVHRHPWAVLTGVLAILAVLALPLRDLDLRNSQMEMLPPSSDLRATYETMQEKYPTSVYSDATVLVDAEPAQAGEFVADIAALEGVQEARITETGEDGFTTVSVFVEGEDPGSDLVVGAVESIRAMDPGFETWTMGAAAGQIDFVDAIVDGLPWAAAIVFLATFVLLFLMTGSVLVPIKALLMNVVSMAATLGVTVWVFEGGHLGSLLGFEAVPGLETYVVAVIVAFGFGLAMDYEVFLISRIKEHWDEGHDNDSSVEYGLQRSGRIITSAAFIMMAVFFGFAFGELTVIKEVGIGLAAAVLIDATLVRVLLVPATMTLLGKWNWWAPRWMRKIHDRFAIEH